MLTNRNMKDKTRKFKTEYIKYLILASTAIILYLILYYIFNTAWEFAAIITTFIMLVLVLYISIAKNIYKTFTKAPFSGLVGLTLSSFILLPLFFSFSKNNNIPDLIYGFFSIAIPIGVNSAVDGLFKIIETNFKSEEKLQVVRYGGTIKFLFNSLYIATILGVITIQTLLSNCKNGISFFSIKFNPQEVWATLYLLTMFYLLIICFLGSLISKAIQKEIKNNDVANIEQIKRKIIEKKQTIANIQNQLNTIDKDISIRLQNLENKLNTELESLDSLE